MRISCDCVGVGQVTFSQIRVVVQKQHVSKLRRVHYLDVLQMRTTEALQNCDVKSCVFWFVCMCVCACVRVCVCTRKRVFTRKIPNLETRISFENTLVEVVFNEFVVSCWIVHIDRMASSNGWQSAKASTKTFSGMSPDLSVCSSVCV